MTNRLLQILPAILIFTLAACNNPNSKKDKISEPVSFASEINNRLSLTTKDSLQKPYFDSASGFYIDPSEINSNEYKQYDLNQNDVKSNKKLNPAEHKKNESKLESDSIISLLTSHQWTTCGRFDSVNQYRRVQFIDKAL